VLAHIGGLPLEEALWASPGLLLGAGALAHSWRARLARARADARRALRSAGASRRALGGRDAEHREGRKPEEGIVCEP
jgi:hypothetical protein